MYSLLSSRYLLNTSRSEVIKTPPSYATSVLSGFTGEYIISSSSASNDSSTNSNVSDNGPTRQLENSVRTQDLSPPITLDMTPEHQFLEYIDPFPAKPPSYDSANPNKSIRYPIYETPQISSQSTAELPPEYSPAVNEITLVQIKHEWLSPYEPAVSVDWKDVIMEINSTQLNFYTIDNALMKYRNKVRSRSEVSDVKKGNDKMCNKVSNESLKENCKRKLINFTSSMFNKSRCSKLDAHDQQIICGVVSANKKKYLNESTLYKTYSLQFARFGIATDYTKKLLVLRLRCESEQFLINFTQVDDMIEWSVFLSMGIFVALDIELREYPDYRIVPPRRRRRRRKKRLTALKGNGRLQDTVTSGMQQGELSPILANIYGHEHEHEQGQGQGYDSGVCHFTGVLGRPRSSSHGTTKMLNTFLKSVLTDAVHFRCHNDDEDDVGIRYVRTQDDKINEIYRNISREDGDTTYDGPRNTPHLYKSLSGQQLHSSSGSQRTPSYLCQRPTHRTTLGDKLETSPELLQHSQDSLNVYRTSVVTLPTHAETKAQLFSPRGTDSVKRTVNTADSRSGSENSVGIGYSDVTSPSHVDSMSPRFRCNCPEHISGSPRSPTSLRSPLSADNMTFDRISNVLSHPTSLSSIASNQNNWDGSQSAHCIKEDSILPHHPITKATDNIVTSTTQEGMENCTAFRHFLSDHFSHVPFLNEFGTESENDEIYDDEDHGHVELYENDDTYVEDFEDTKWSPPIKEMSRRKYIKDSLRCIKSLTESQDWLASVVVRPVDAPSFETPNESKIPTEKKSDQKFSFQRKLANSCPFSSRASSTKDHHLEAFVITPSGFVKAENDVIRYLSKIKRKDGSNRNGVNWASIY